MTAIYYITDLQSSDRLFLVKYFILIFIQVSNSKVFDNTTIKTSKFLGNLSSNSNSNDEIL